MQFWCLAPLPTGEEPRQKLMSEDYQPPAVVLLKTYQLDSSVGDDEDSDPEVSDDMVDQPEASSATRPGRKMRAAIAKLSSSRATVMAATTKIAKLEADKNMRKRKVIPTPASKEIEEEDEATDDPLVVDNRTAPRSPSPVTRRHWDMERHVMEEDLHCIREAQVAAVGAQAKMLLKIRVCPLSQNCVRWWL
jgi:hypothetical protein